MKAQQTTAGPQEHDHTTTERDRIWGNSGQGQQHGRGQAGTRTRATSVRAVDTGQLNRQTAKTHRQGATDMAREKWENRWGIQLCSHNKIHGN